MWNWEVSLWLWRCFRLRWHWCLYDVRKGVTRVAAALGSLLRRQPWGFGTPISEIFYEIAVEAHYLPSSLEDEGALPLAALGAHRAR